MLIENKVTYILLIIFFTNKIISTFICSFKSLHHKNKLLQFYIHFGDYIHHQLNYVDISCAHIINHIIKIIYHIHNK